MSALSPSKVERQTLLRVGVVLLVLCGLTTAFSVWSMAARVNAFYAVAPPAQFEFQQITARTLKPFGYDLALADTILPDGRSGLEISYGSSRLLLPVHAPKVRTADVSPEKAQKLDLAVYEEWLALLAFLPVKDGSVVADLARSSGRLVLVKRNAAPGHDDEMGGTVNRKNWTFDILEFLPSGSIAPMRTLQFPSTEYRTGKPYLPAAKQDPATTVQPIAERSWEFQAALYTIPKLQIANYRFKTDAVAGSSDAKGMGWTLPAAGFSIMGLMLGLVLVSIARLNKPPAPVSAPSA